MTNLFNTDIGYNQLYSTNPTVTTFLDSKDADWNQTQTIPPTNVQAATQSNSSVALTWTPIPYTADGGYYQIRYATTPGGPYSTHGVTTDKNASGYTATGLTPDTTYYFVVRTYTPAHGDQQNELWSDNSQEVSATTTTLDTTAPTSSVTAPSGTSSSTSFTVQWSGTDNGSGVKDYDVQVQTNGGSWADWRTNTIATSASYSGSDGNSYCFRSRAEDNAGNVESYPSGADKCVTVDTSSIQPDLLIDNDSFSLSTSSICLGQSVTIYATEKNQGGGSAGAHILSYYDDVSSSVHSNQVGSDSITSLATNATTSQNHTFTPTTAGTRYLKAYADSGNNVTEPIENNNWEFAILTVNQDTTAPTGSISINNGATDTTASNVTFTLSANDSGDCAGNISQMRFSNNGTTWSSWESYSTSKSYTLPSGDGVKTVYVQFKDSNGNISSSVSDSITLDTTPAATYTLSGQVIDSGGTPLAGVTLSAGTHTTTTDNNGAYVIVGLPAGSYTLVPAKEGYTFSPANRSVSVPDSQANQDFTATSQTPDVRLIDVTMTLYKSAPDSADRQPYEEILNYFADGVYEMSNGRHKIRNVTIYQNGEAVNTADIVWNASEWPRAYISAYGHDKYPVFMGDVFPFPTPYNALLETNHKGAGYTLAHEWGHYYYGLYDEYRASKEKICHNQDNEIVACRPSSPRVTDLPVADSVMNSQWNARNGDFAWLNFSIAKNNTGQTAQHRMFGASGWETLARPTHEDPRADALTAKTRRTYYPELSAVAPGTNQDAPIELPHLEARSNLNISWMVSGQAIKSSETELRASIISVSGQEVSYPNSAILVANIFFPAPVAKAELEVQLTHPDGSVSQATLADDGQIPDEQANDGLYSGFLPYTQSGSHQLVATFTNNSGQAEYTQLSYNYATGPNGETPDLTPQPVGENFTAVATTTIVVTDFAADDHSDTTGGATLLPTDNTDTPGRIDRAGDVDVFKVETAGSHILRVTDLALDMQPVIRLLDSGGNETDQFTPDFNDGYFFTPLIVSTGQPVYVTIAHADTTAAGGLYNVSVGPALTAENTTATDNDVYLPIIIK